MDTAGAEPVRQATTEAHDDPDFGARCQIVRGLGVIGEKWSLLVVRDAFRGRTRFSEFRDSLGAPSDVLSNRLGKLVDAGVLEKRAYREQGARERSSYHLTEKGRGLAVVLGALVQWTDTFDPHPEGEATRVVDAEHREPVSLAFVDGDGRAVPGDSVAFVPGPGARERW